VGDLKHRLTVRLSDEHVDHLNEIANASGLKRNEVVRRALLGEEIPSAAERRDIQQILRVQKEQNRLGGLLKKALTEREEKASLRRTLAEIERNAAELRRLIGHIRGVS
jgi:predicted transcriptional regulator